MEGNSGGGGGASGAASVVGSGGGGGAASGNDVELLCKTLQVEHKLFYFDLKENPRGRYLKISEKTSATRSTIIVPFSGISWFLDLFNYYVNSDDQDVFSKELQLDTKATNSLTLLLSFSLFLIHSLKLLCPIYQVFYFDVGENRRGRFLKVIPSNWLDMSSFALTVNFHDNSISHHRLCPFYFLFIYVLSLRTYFEAVHFKKKK